MSYIAFGYSLLKNCRKNQGNLDTSNSWYYTEGETYYISQLNPKQINNLYITSCNSGNLDFIIDNKAYKKDSQIKSDELGELYCDNIALSFLKSNNSIKKVYGMDGYSTYINGVDKTSAIRGGFSDGFIILTSTFPEWSKDVNNDKIRMSEGVICYWYDTSGNVNYCPNQKHFIISLEYGKI